MKIVCTADLPYGMEAFSTIGETILKPERILTSEDIKDADILAVRSTTKVGGKLLSGTRVKFVGTATIGTDHMDLQYLESSGIAWCSSAGCNANSVSEYFTSAMLLLAQKHGFELKGKTLGIIGVGNVGKKVADKAQALGMHLLLNDPPRQRTEGGTLFVSLDEVLRQSDIITLHVPYEKGGADPTHHLANEEFFNKMKPGSIFMNAARGAVVYSDALLKAIGNGRISHTILDTWEGEPLYRRDVLAKVDVATPHIAGHSWEGKVVGTAMVYEAACKYLAIQPRWSSSSVLAPTAENPARKIVLQNAKGSHEALLWEVVRQAYDVTSDDQEMRSGCVEDDQTRAANFNKQRKNYPIRREFPFHEVLVSPANPSLSKTLKALGFQA